jgi:hypothetical protein
MSLIGIFVLLGGSFFPNMLEAPPRDLASLVRPEPALQQMGVTVEEDALIALLKGEAAAVVDEQALRDAAANLGAADFDTRDAAAETLRSAGEAARSLLKEAAGSDDPEVRVTAENLLRELDEAQRSDLGDTLYVKRLLAIRVLEAMKSEEALPVLQEWTASDDPMLALAAKQAAQIIRGEEIAVRPTEAILEDVTSWIPSNAGFVQLLDLSRNPKARTLLAILTEAFKEPALQDIQKMYMPIPPVEQIVTSMEGEILKIIGTIGNVQLDVAAVVLPERMGVTRADTEALLILKGRYDRDRIRGHVQDYPGNETTRVGEVEVHQVRGEEPALAMPDGETMLIALGQPETPGVLARFMTSAMERRGQPLPAHIVPAFAMLEDTESRLVASGALSDAQKKLMRAELEAEKERLAKRRQEGNVRETEALESAFLAVGSGVLQAETLTGRLAPEAGVIAEVRFNAPGAAAKFADDLAAAEQATRELLKGNMGEAPPVFRQTLRKLVEEPLVTATVKERGVEVKTGAIGMLPMIIFELSMRRTMRRVNPPAPKATPTMPR